MNTKGKFPIVAQADLIVVGGTSAAVAAACSACKQGASVFLAAGESYFGEDICGPAQFWLKDGEKLEHPIAEKIFTDKSGRPVSPVSPLDVKRNLDDVVLEAGIDFLLSVRPADILVEDGGAIVGVVLTGKSGQFAVRGDFVIDATPLATLARAAGESFTDWPGGTLTFKRIVAGHPGTNRDFGREIALEGAFSDEKGNPDTICKAFEYQAELELDGWTPSALAEAEQVMRDHTWHPKQLWGADRSIVTPPVWLDRGLADDKLPATVTDDRPFQSSIEGFYILGPCSAISRALATDLQRAPAAIKAGEMLGCKIDCKVKTASKPAISNLKPLNRRPEVENEIEEPYTGRRFTREADAHIAYSAGMRLPALGEFDVVVVGGGTGGAPAAIAAARSGSKVLVIEMLHGLGGVGTLGYIASYYHGYRQGFTSEMTEGLSQISDIEKFNRSRPNLEHKSEWLRRRIREAGGEIWYDTISSGVLLEESRIRGVVVNAPWGRGIVKAEVVIDATGNADIAAFAGAPCNVVSDSDLAVQGSGLSPRRITPGYVNSDYTFIDDTDPVDITRAFVLARRKFQGYFDISQLPNTRERRQIKGDATVTPLNAYTGSTWHDTICLSRSNFDSHGFTVHPLFFVLPPDKRSWDVWLPFRAMLPEGVEGIIVTGLGISAHRDVMPVLRMQADVQNHSYAAGLAAATAAENGVPLRKLDIRALQRRLADKGIVPQAVLLNEDGDGLTEAVIISAASGDLRHHSELAALMARPKASIPLLKKRLKAEPNQEKKVTCAKLLAFMGNNAGEEVLINTVDPLQWDEGWNYRGMGQFGRSMSAMDDLIVALAYLRSMNASGKLLEKAAQLEADDAFSHFRAIALYAESIESSDWAKLLGEWLSNPEISGFAACSYREMLADVQCQKRYPIEHGSKATSPTDDMLRNKALRELYLARALYRCGDKAGLAASILNSYVRDVRGHYARHAASVIS